MITFKIVTADQKLSQQSISLQTAKSMCYSSLRGRNAEASGLHLDLSGHTCGNSCAHRRGTVGHCGMEGMGSVVAAGAPFYAPQAQLPTDCHYFDQAALALGAAAAGQLGFGDGSPMYTSDGVFQPTKVCGRAACAGGVLGSWLL